MNRLRTPHKTTSNADEHNDSSSQENHHGGKGILNKLQKRYSTLSNKITRRHQSSATRNKDSAGKSTAQKLAISGSYNMTGAHSEDHRPEIGAPILISTTTLDTERLDVSEARLKQIGGGIAITSTINRPIIVTVNGNSLQSSPQIPSSGSENEVYVDALSSTPPAIEEDNFVEANEQFESSTDSPSTPTKVKRYNSDTQITTVPLRNSSHSTSNSPAPASPKCVYKELAKKHLTLGSRDHLSESSTDPMQKYYEVIKPARSKNKLNKTISAQHLNRAELKVYLQKAPSLVLNKSLTTADFEHCRDLPMLPELYGASKCSLAPTTDTEADDADKENSSPSVVMAVNPSQSKSELNMSSPMSTDQKINNYLNTQQQFKSVDSLDIHRRSSSKRRSVAFSSSNSLHQHGSKMSLTSQNSSFMADFDLKSVSCQSLNAQNLFVSIDELNEITRQINESEEFTHDIDLEYCQHRDQLRPSERRITLLKHKNARLINFNHNKEKLKKGWTGVKHWLGEESSKLKEVMTSRQSGRPAITNAPTESVRGSSQTINTHDQMESTLSLQQSGICSATTTGTGTRMESSLALNNSCDNITEVNEDASSQVNVSQQEHCENGCSPTSTNAKYLEGQNGFEELRRFVKQGGDFTKELILILQERVDSELLYSKSLSKMANKLNKACRELPGSIAEAWRGVATEMENRSDVHRQLSASLTEEIVKPLKNIVDCHHKARKSVESNVDKSARALSEWRISEAKGKKVSHTAARENEKLQDAMLDVRIQKSPSIALLHQGPNKVAAEREIKSAEKDCAKLDNKRKKAEEAVKRADVEYYTLCIRAERARIDWEMAVLRGSTLLQNLENQRLLNMKQFVSNYACLTANMNPILEGLVQRLQPQVDACSVLKDMQVVKNILRNAEGPSEQLLPDFYCEHTTLAMNRERRKHALIKLLQLVKADLERERRSRNGLKGLSQSLNNQDNQNITDKLYHIRSMLTYLEGARFKLQSALLELDHKPRSSHPLAQHIQVTRDRTGLQQSILKVPMWLKNNDKTHKLSNGTDDANNSTVITEHEYDDVSQNMQHNTTNTMTNISCVDLSKDMLYKNFSRSKSNIETFSTHTHISVLGSANNKNHHKNKTIPANLQDPYSDRGQADGGSNQQDSDFDEFSSQDEDEEQQLQNNAGAAVIVNSKSNQQNHYQNTAEICIEPQEQTNTIITTTPTTTQQTEPTVVLSRCKALYSYTPKLYDELELNPGDIIEVHAKQEDGWWLGALRNQVGIFPATYVEEFP